MKNIFILFLTIIFSSLSFAQDHTHHAKHNMVLFGNNDSYYVSHIVYKVPHNYQVILKVNFNANAKELIGQALKDHGSEQFIFLLDHMDISRITERPTISGEIFRRSEDGVKNVIIKNVEIPSSDYSILYFDELPLSLSSM